VHLDGCAEVEAAYYSAPPGWIGRKVHVKWDGRFVRLLDPKNGNCCVSICAANAAATGSKKKTARSARPWAWCNCWHARPARAGEHIGQFCELMHSRQLYAKVRPIH